MSGERGVCPDVRQRPAFLFATAVSGVAPACGAQGRGATPGPREHATRGTPAKRANSGAAQTFHTLHMRRVTHVTRHSNVIHSPMAFESAATGSAIQMAVTPNPKIIVAAGKNAYDKVLPLAGDRQPRPQRSAAILLKWPADRQPRFNPNAVPDSDEHAPRGTERGTPLSNCECFGAGRILCAFDLEYQRSKNGGRHSRTPYLLWRRKCQGSNSTPRSAAPQPASVSAGCYSCSQIFRLCAPNSKPQFTVTHRAIIDADMRLGAFGQCGGPGDPHFLSTLTRRQIGAAGFKQSFEI